MNENLQPSKKKFFSRFKLAYIAYALAVWIFANWLATDGPSLANPFVPLRATQDIHGRSIQYGFPFNSFGAECRNEVQENIRPGDTIDVQGVFYCNVGNIGLLNVLIVALVLLGPFIFIAYRKKTLRIWLWSIFVSLLLLALGYYILDLIASRREG